MTIRARGLLIDLPPHTMSDLSLLLSAAVLATFPNNISKQEAADWRLLQAIALVESGADPATVGDRGRALGAWQMHAAAWIDANNWLRSNGRKTWSRARWRNEEAQRELAYAFLQVCKSRLSAGGHQVNAMNIALVWNMGYSNFDDAKRCNKEPCEKRIDYATRVQNIFLHAK